MGAKTGLLAFTPGPLPISLRVDRPAAPDHAAALVARVHPGCSVQRIGDGTLGAHTHPPQDTVYAAVLDGVSLLASPSFMVERPSELPDHLIEAADGDRIVLHAMDPTSGRLAFGVWQDGRLDRSLSLCPTSGVVEDIGAPLEVERSLRTTCWRVDPVELGERVLRSLFGFATAERPDPDGVDPHDVVLHGFQVTDPAVAGRAARAAEAAAREATREAAMIATFGARPLAGAPDR